MLPNRSSIAKYIKQQRESLGWSQRELGRRLGCPHATVNQWESGKATPDTESLGRIASLLGLQLSELFRLIEQDTVLTSLPNSLDLKRVINALDTMPPSDLAMIGNAVMQKLAKAS